MKSLRRWKHLSQQLSEFASLFYAWRHRPKTVSRQAKLNPVEVRRNKLLAGIEEQLKVAEAAMRGEEYTVTLSRWGKSEDGEKVRVQRQKFVRSWFFAQDGGFYVQCKYGARTIALSKEGNAVFVKQLADVPTALQAIYAATAAGELDAAIACAVKRESDA